MPLLFKKTNQRLTYTQGNLTHRYLKNISFSTYSHLYFFPKKSKYKCGEREKTSARNLPFLSLKIFLFFSANPSSSFCDNGLCEIRDATSLRKIALMVTILWLLPRSLNVWKTQIPESLRVKNCKQIFHFLPFSKGNGSQLSHFILCKDIIGPPLFRDSPKLD